MLWRRFLVFASLWWQLFAWGQSRVKKAVTVIGMIIAAIGIRAFLDTILILNLLLNDTPHVFTVRIGTLIAGALLVAWALITGALAWERSGVPILIVGDHLEWDGIRFRLPLESKDKPCDTSVRLLEIVDITGRRIFQPSRLNLDLEWTHHSGQSAVHIEANQRESVSVATIHDNGRYVELIFTREQPIKIACRLSTRRSSTCELRTVQTRLIDGSVLRQTPNPSTLRWKRRLKIRFNPQLMH